jgi:hypothetical protein
MPARWFDRESVYHGFADGRFRASERSPLISLRRCACPGARAGLGRCPPRRGIFRELAILESLRWCSNVAKPRQDIR